MRNNDYLLRYIETRDYQGLESILERDYAININARHSSTNNSLLDYCAAYNYIELAQLLLKHGAKIETENTNGALWWAILYGNIQIIELLLKNGANVNHIYSPIGLSPIWAIFEFNHKLDQDKIYEICQILIKNGVDLSVKAFHSTLFSNALYKKYYKLALLFCKNGYQIDNQDQEVIEKILAKDDELANLAVIVQLSMRQGKE